MTGRPALLAPFLAAPRLTVIGALLVALFAVAAAAPLLGLPDPVAMAVADRLAAPSWSHLLGTDEYGRDVLSRIVWGARVTLAVSLGAAAIAGVIGVSLALVGGWFGGLAELLTIRVADVVVSFPPILLALLVVTLLGPGTGTLLLVLSVLYVPGFTRVAYGEVLSARAQEYVEASRALGAGWVRILTRTILHNILPPILVQFSLTVAAAIVIESGLSFLGLGVVPPAPSWGQMIRGARSAMEQDPLLLVWPSLALVVTIVLVNAFCDALRDHFDPRSTAIARRRPAAAAAAPAAAADDPVDPSVVLSIRDLTTVFDTPNGMVRAVDGVSFDLKKGEILAVVGESGSGKSMTGLSVMGLLPKPIGRIAGGRAWLRRRDDTLVDLARLDEDEARRLRGREIAMVFQEPMTSLNPVYRVGDQIAEAVVVQRGLSKARAREVAVTMLERVGIPEPARRARAFPHQLSGGMRQRAMIALALVGNPSVLIADEPTTALDVTVQAEIIDLMRDLQQSGDGRMGIVFVTHNLGVVAQIADRIVVMYAGRVVETGPRREVFLHPRHPYTRGLIASVPRPSPDAERGDLEAIPGVVPSPFAMPPGCAFAPRCALARPGCDLAVPDLVAIGPDHATRCLHWRDL